MSVPVAIMSTVTAMRSWGESAELLDERLAICRLAGLGMLGLVGDLFAEVVALAEDLAAEVDDVLGVGVVFAKMRVFGTRVRPGKSSVGSASRKACRTVRI